MSTEETMEETIHCVYIYTLYIPCIYAEHETTMGRRLGDDGLCMN